MDRDIHLGNRVIANYMQQKEKRRLKQRLKHIKTNKSQYSSQGHIKDKPRTNSLMFEKSQQIIQKQNIALFNRIASIIKKAPKIITTPQHDASTLTLQKSRQTTTIWHRRLQSSLEEENKLIEKRLFNQKPTINNKSFYQQRARHLQYVKNISKYPYILNKNVKTQPDIGNGNNVLDEININVTELPPIQDTNNMSRKRISENANCGQSCVKQLFCHRSLDFSITILMDLKHQVCTFVIQNTQSQQQKYTLTIPKIQFIAFFQESEYDYEKMISNLRLNDDGKILYVNDSDNGRKAESPKNDKDGFKNKVQSTAYTSTGFKCGFRASKRIMTEKSQKKEREFCKTDTKVHLLKASSKKSQIKQLDLMSENKFNQGNI